MSKYCYNLPVTLEELEMLIETVSVEHNKELHDRATALKNVIALRESLLVAQETLSALSGVTANEVPF